MIFEQLIDPPAEFGVSAARLREIRFPLAGRCNFDRLTDDRRDVFRVRFHV
jgi:hypothetical protein